MQQRSLEQLLGSTMGSRRKARPPIRWVNWTAHMQDGDVIYLDDIKHARRVAALGWAIKGVDVGSITRTSGAAQQEFYPGDTIQA